MARLGNTSSHQLGHPGLLSVFMEQSLPIELAQNGGLTLHLQGEGLRALFAQYDPILAKLLDARTRIILDAMHIQKGARHALTALTTGDPMHTSQVRSEMTLSDDIHGLLYDVFGEYADIDDLHTAFKRAEKEGQEYALIEVFNELTRLSKIETDSERQRAFDAQENSVPCMVNEVSMTVPLAHSMTGIVIDGEAFENLKREVGAFLARHAKPYFDETQRCYLGPVADETALTLNLVPRTTRFWKAQQVWRDRPSGLSERDQWSWLKPYMIAWSVMANL